MASSGPGGGNRSSWRGRGGEGFGTRGRGRGTGARGSQSNWRGSARGGRTDPKGERQETRPIGPLIGTVRLSEVQSTAQSSEAAPTIEDCEYVASYTWLNRKEPTILVPGKSNRHDSHILFADVIKDHHLYGLHQMCPPHCNKTAVAISGTQMPLAGQNFPWSQLLELSLLFGPISLPRISTWLGVETQWEIFFDS